MQPLATQFEDRSYRYTQLTWQEDLAIFAQRHKTNAAVVRYEVVCIRVQVARTWPNGQTTPAQEVYPSASAWGLSR
jgi:hypothetical protein